MGRDYHDQFNVDGKKSMLEDAHLEERVEDTICETEVQRRESQSWVLCVQHPRLNQSIPQQRADMQIPLLELSLTD